MTLLVSVTLAALLTPQAPPPASAPSFDAASIRISAPRTRITLKTDPGRLSATGVSLSRLIEEAYAVSPLQIAGVPALGSFDIVATVPGTHTRAELLAMLQTLLAERFKLAVHREMREMPVLAVTATQAWKGQPTTVPDADPTVGLRADRGDGRGADSKVQSVFFDGQNATVAFIARYVEPRFQRVVIDQTGLTGGFDFHVTVPIDAERAADPNVPEREVAKDLVTDFIDELGLKMERRRAMVEILVVDHAEQPGDN